MSQLEDGSVPSIEQIRSCLAVYARHRPRADDLPRCAFCAGAWRQTRSEHTGAPIHGCAARQLAGRALDAAGHLDDQGNLITNRERSR